MSAQATGIDADRFAREWHDWHREHEARLADNQLPSGPRARLLFGLAHVLDARGDFRRAGDSLREANRLSIELNQQRRDYQPAEHEQFLAHFRGLLGLWVADQSAR